MKSTTDRICFFLFFVSGLCGLLYQTVWTRLAFAAFGVITPVMSVVISVFMLGLAIGSWLGGKHAASLSKKFNCSPIMLYGIAEAIIGLSAIVVPAMFKVARQVLLSIGALDSLPYLLCSALALSIILLPWCICMGSTFPLMMAFLRGREEHTEGSFSFLYLGNCLGAMLGTLATAFVLIELLGFNNTLTVGAAGNFLIAGISLILAKRAPQAELQAQSHAAPAPPITDKLSIWILFLTGFASMAMEVVWIRAFLYAIGHEVYSFAQLLAVYLFGTCMGSFYYRLTAQKKSTVALPLILAMLAGCCLLPLLLNDLTFRSLIATTIGALAPASALNNIVGSIHVYVWDPHNLLPAVSHFTALLSIIPCSAMFGYITPRIIDECSEGRAETAGSLYAINTVGCILGPLIASYILLPYLGVKTSLILLSIPFAIPMLKLWPFPKLYDKLAAASVACAFIACIPALPYEELAKRSLVNCQVRRDYAATVLNGGTSRDDACLLVNGSPVTSLNQCTKNIGHFPLLALSHDPKSALVICFGMGTTFRSLNSWDIDVTAVELVPSVVKSFSFFHKDADQVLAKPTTRIVVDDGRRFLQRTDKRFDLITIDPSPVMEKGCMSLMLSSEFFDLVKRRLTKGGIYEMFYGYFDEKTIQAVTRSLTDQFKYVRIFDAPGAGMYSLASDEPIQLPTDAAQLVAKLPPHALADLTEWTPGDQRQEAQKHLDLILSREIDVNKFLNPDLSIKCTDDRPYTEYFLLRSTRDRMNGTFRPLNPEYLTALVLKAKTTTPAAMHPNP